MLSRARLLGLNAALLAVALIAVNQNWFLGSVNQTEVVLTGGQAVPGLAAFLTLQVVFIAIAFYIRGWVVAVVSTLFAITNAWFAYFSLTKADNAPGALIDAGLVSKASGQMGNVAGLFELVNNPITSTSLFVAAIALSLLCLVNVTSVFVAPKWQLAKRAKNTKRTSETTFDLWDAQR